MPKVRYRMIAIYDPYTRIIDFDASKLKVNDSIVLQQTGSNIGHVARTSSQVLVLTSLVFAHGAEFDWRTY